MFKTLVPLATLLALVGCSQEVTAPPALTAKTEQAVFTNGGFESDAIGAVPSGWTREKYLNNKVTPLANGATSNNLGLLAVPPESTADLNLTPDAGGFNVSVVGALLTSESQADPQLGAGQSLRYPKFGLRSAVVNPGNANQGPSDAAPTGRNNSAGALRQRTTLSAGDVDPLDGKVHLRFVAAPVLENPGHTNFEQPYFYIEVRNVTRNTLLYSNFNFAGQTGVAWKDNGGGIQYTDWQLIDVAPGEDALIGEDVELVVYAAGCSRGGHFGHVYVDAFGATIPGLYVTGTAPAQSPNNTTLTYTLTYRNGGTAAVGNTQVTFNTPPNTTFASLAAAGLTCTSPAAGAAGVVTCTVGTLAANASGSFTITVNVPSTVTGILTAQNYSIQGTTVNPLLGSKIDTLIFAGPATLTQVSGSPQSTIVNTAFGADMVVRVRDGNNALMKNVVVTFAAPATGASAVLPRTMVRTDANGLATLRPSANTITGTYNVTATAANVTGVATFAMTNNPGAPAVVNVVSGTPQSATRLQAFGAPLIVEVRDAFGNLVPNAAVTFTAPAAGASAGLTVAAVTDANGRTQVTATANGTAGTYNVTASVAGGTTSATFALTNNPGPATALQIISGSPQSATVNTAFGTSLVVAVVDAGGNAVPGVTVNFVAPATGARAVLSALSGVSGADGRVTITATAGTVAGTYNVVASSTGLAPVNFALANTAGAPAAITTVSGTPQSATVLTAFVPLVVLVVDAFGNPVSGATVTFARPGAGASNTGTVTATTGANGQASVTPTANGVAGTYNETATVTGVATAATFVLTNTPGAATTIVIVSGTPQSTVVSTAFGAQLVVRANDAQGNAVPGAVISFSAPSSGASASVPSTATTGANGQAGVTATANATAGSYSVTATLGGVTRTFALTNTAGAAASITTVSGTPQSRVVLTAFAAPLVAVVRDASNNPVSGATVTFTKPATGASATVAATATTNAQGQVSVPATANATAGTYNVTASVTGVTTPATFVLTNTPGAPASITVVSGSPQSAAAGTAFAPLVVVVRDAQGNVVPNATVTFAAPASGATAALSATSATTDAQGQVSLPANAGTTPGTYTVTASVTGVATAASFSLTNTAGAPASISVSSGSNQTTVVLTVFPAPLIAVVRDASNNPVSGVTVSFAAPTTGASATVAASATTNAQGQVSVPVTANGIAGAYVVNATVTGVTTPAAFNLTNTPGPAASVTVESGSNQTAAVNAAFADPLVVVVKDAQGNPIANSTVTFTVPGSGASATVTVTVTTDANGRASTPAAANSTVGAYTVTATVTGVPTPATFNLTNAASVPASIALDSGGAQSAQVTTAYAQPLVFVVRDASMNPVPNARVDLTVPTTGASVTLSNTSLRTDAQGKVSVTATANTIAGPVQVSAVVSGVTTPATASLTNTPGDAVGVRVVSGGSQSTATGTAFPSPLLVEAIDAWGNVVPNAVLTWTAPGTGPGATLSAMSTTTDANGRASITATANGEAGSYPVTVRLPGGQQADFVLTNSGSGSVVIAVASGAPQSTVVATAYAQPLVARVTQNNNPVANAQVTFLVPGAGPSVTLSAITAQTNAQGLATVTATANTRAGAVVVSASTPGGAQPATFALTNTPGPAAALIPAQGSTPQTAQTGTDFGAPLTLTVVDQYGNPVPNADVTFTTPATGAGATLSSSTVTSDANGNVTVTATANGTVGAYDVTATATGVTTPATFTLTNTAARPLVLTILEGTPQQAVVDTAFTAPLHVRVTQDGAPVVGAVVTFTPPANTVATAVLSAPSATTDAQGEASLTATAGRIAGRYTVAATVPNGAAPARFELRNAPGAPAAVQVLTAATPQSTVVLTPFALPLTVTVLDAFMNAVPGTTVTFAPPATEPTATLTTTAPVTDGNGQASVAAIAGAQPGSYDVTATVAGVAAPGVFRLTNVAGGPSVISVVSGADQSTEATTAFPNPVVLEVKDSAGQPFAGTFVTMVLPTTGPSASTMASSFTTDSSGRVTIAFTANDVPGAFDARFTVTGVATAATVRLTITPIATTTSVAVNPTSPSTDVPGELVATVTSGNGTPTGTVRFEVDGAAAGTATLSNGKATLSGVQLTAGTHDVAAFYDAQGAFGASRSTVDTFEVRTDQGSLNGGGGCSSSGGGVSAVQWLLALLGVLFLSSRRRVRQSARAVAAVAVVTSTIASAQATSGVSLNIFHPAPAGSDWFGGDSLDLRGKVRPSARLLFDYGHNPLVVYNADGSVRSIAVANQAFLNAQVSLVALDRIRIGVTLPIALHSGSFNASFNGESLRPANEAGIGDLGITADVRLVGTYGSPFTLAIGALLGLPTGDPNSFFGDGRVTVTPRIAAAGEISRFAYTAHVAYAFRQGSLAGVPINNELRYGVTAGLLFFDRKFLIGPELHGMSDFTSGNVGRATALEVDLGAHVQFHPDWRVGVGGGTGLTRAVGVPDYRLLASLQWQPHYEAPRTDRDRDGVYDEEDVCPDTAMGAHPDLSRTGCPLNDNDHDGIFDDDDLCPTVHKGSTPDPKRVGCPDPDTDGDGILDSVDLCPNVARGETPDPAKLGCPDLDTDGDGVTDSVDQCKTEPMGAKPDRSKRGCPLHDRDDDGIVDENDACPDKPGSPNTDPKKNGCPGLVKLEGSKILILTPVNFATAKDTILPSSNSVLNAVAETLKTFPDIEQLSIEGHTDSKGKPAYNKDLSQRRANSVMRWLVEHGIDAGKLEAHGFGQEQPIDDNKTEAGRAKNRRVEFKIIKRAGDQ